MTNKRILTI